MKRRTKVIQISGFRGLVMAIFVVTCLAAGFVAFPSIVAMYIWNGIAAHIAIPVINGVQGLMLWAIVAIVGFIINDKHKYLSTFSSTGKLSEAELRSILDKAKLHARTLDNIALKSGDIKPVAKEEDKEKENV